MGLSAEFAERLLKGLTGYSMGNNDRTLYLGLSTTVPNTDGSNFTEPSVSVGYERLVLVSQIENVFGDVQISPLEDSVYRINEKAAVNAIATGSWGTIRAFGLFFTASGGTPHIFGTISEALNITTDQLPVLGKHELIVYMSEVIGNIKESALRGLFGYCVALQQSAPLASQCYLGLSTTSPENDGSNFTEPPSYAGYTRVLLGNNNSHTMSLAQAYGDGTYYTFNEIQITFGTPSLSWGTLTHWGLFASATGGTPVVWGALETAVAIERNYIPIFKIGALTITI